jgi:hypothetical protein
MRAAAIGLALAVAVTPLGVAAQGRGGAHGGAGARPGAGAPRAAAPRAGAPHSQSAPPGGFNLNRDIGAPANRPVVHRPPVVSRPPVVNRAPVVSRPPVANRPPVNGNGRRNVVANPARRGQRAWEWNRGVAWAPAPTYWGGGFWGPFALGAAAAAIGTAGFGSFTDPSTNSLLTSYQVAPGSPGAALLENYQLTQTPCGPPGLVVIFGPDNSVICAAPSNLVGPGEYDLDSSNLTLVSQ